jgi:hypothetical protein
MPVARQPQVGLQPVGPHRPAGLDRLSDEAVQRGLGQVGNTPQTDAADPRTVRLRRDDDQGLVIGQATGDRLLIGPPIGFVHLDHARQAVPPRPNHGPAEFVQQGPGRLVAAQPEYPLQAQSAGAVLLAGHVPHGPEPDGEGQMAVLKDRARGHRRLAPAGRAQPQTPRHAPGGTAGTARADKTRGPAKREEITATGRVLGKAKKTATRAASGGRSLADTAGADAPSDARYAD